MDKWICKESVFDEWFTVGKIYTTTSQGYLVDDDGDERLRPESYNFAGVGWCFEKVTDIENE